MKEQIIRLTQMARKHYYQYEDCCGAISRIAQKHVDWSDDVSCFNIQGDGLVIGIGDSVCLVEIFFRLHDKGILTEEEFLINCF